MTHRTPTTFSTAEIKARLEAMFADRPPAAPPEHAPPRGSHTED
ncbi:hypothetical protein [Rhodococcus sp. 14C212]|nr:hypothetical protein [Rhodococcus sp. 14C212]